MLTESKPPAGPPALPPSGPVWQSADALVAWCDARLAAAETRLAALPKATKRTVANTLDTVNALYAELDAAGGMASLMFSVHPDKTVRDAANGCTEKVERLDSRIKTDRAVYDAVAAVDIGKADAHTRRYVERLLREFRRAGVDKDEPTRQRIKAIHEELVKLSQEYRKNVSEDVRHIDITGGIEKLKGLPEDYLKAHAPKDGKIRITTDYPDFYPFQTYVEDGALRKALYQQFLSRGDPKNKPLLEKVLALRHELATTLGHATWAAYQAEDKMVKNAKTIAGFLDDLEKILRPKLEKDVAQVLARKKQDDPKADAFREWDRFYYVGKVREQKFDFDARAVRPYFSYPKVEQGILDLYSELFGLKFVRLKSEPVWHADVKAFGLEQDGKLIGKFYLDMHPRADKFKHAAQFGLETGIAGERIPVASLVCNFADPKVGDGKALMEHGEVTTFFHEFGHLVHHLLAQRTRWVALNGTACEWDFVEAPSQLLEEWAWDVDVLQRFAKHVDTGEAIPAALVKKMRAAEEFGKGVDVMRQLFYASYSFHVHSRDPAKLTLETFTAEMYKKYSPFPQTEGTHIYANFEHLIGYSSMYYTYQWSLAHAKDIFTRFQKEGIQNPKTARAYREAILEPGGAEDAAELVKRFLGRPFSLDAYKAWLEAE